MNRIAALYSRIGPEDKPVLIASGFVLVILILGTIYTIAGGEPIEGTATNLGMSASGVATDHLGNVYIADSVNSRVRRVDVQTGVITTVAGRWTATGVPST